MTGLIAAYKLPAPGQIVQDLVDVALHGYGEASLWHSLLISSLRLLAGVALAGGIGVLIGYATGSSVIIKGLFDPIFEFFRCIPPLGILSLLVVWFGIGERSKIVMLMIAAMTPIVLATAHGIRSIRPERIEGARFARPRGLPPLPGGHPAFGAARDPDRAAHRLRLRLRGARRRRMIGASSGLDSMMWDANRYGETGIVIVSIIVIGIAGFAVDTGLTALRNRLVPWAGGIGASYDDRFRRNRPHAAAGDDVGVQAGIALTSTLPWSILSIGVLLVAWWTATAQGLIRRRDARPAGGNRRAGPRLDRRLRQRDAARAYRREPDAPCRGVRRRRRARRAARPRHRHQQSRSRIVDPWIQLYKPVPSLAYMGLMVLWLGVGVRRVALLALAGLPAIVIGTTEAVRSVRPSGSRVRDHSGSAGSIYFDGDPAVMCPTSSPRCASPRPASSRR